MDSALTAEAAAQLQEGINLVLSRWAALLMAVENEWGGRDSRLKSQELGHQLFYILTQSKEKVYMDDLEDILDEFMLSLNTEIDDGSIEEVAEKLMFMHEECLEGNFDSIKKLREANIPSVSYIREAVQNDDDDSEDDEGYGAGDASKADNTSEMEVDAPQCEANPNTKATTSNDGGKQATIVEDGWTVVPSRRNRGRKN